MAKYNEILLTKVWQNIKKFLNITKSDKNVF
jgi:hypothetical protein